MQAASSLYSGLATFVLFLHALFILWVVFDALVTHSRKILRWLRIASLVWGILRELLPWPSPLTVLETGLKPRPESSRTRVGSFSITSISWSIRMSLRLSSRLPGGIICALNLAFYGRRIWIARHR